MYIHTASVNVRGRHPSYGQPDPENMANDQQVPRWRTLRRGFFFGKSLGTPEESPWQQKGVYALCGQVVRRRILE